MIDPNDPKISIQRQCALVSISRSAFYYRPAGETPLNLALMRLIDEAFLETPWYGSRQVARHLRRQGYRVGRMRVAQADGQDGPGADLSEAAYDDPAPGAPGLQVPAARADHRQAQSGLVRRHYVHPDATGLPVPGPPEIFHTDQGSPFTSPRFVDVLKHAGVRVSMDGRGRWMDNVFIERLWRSLKYECVYIHAFETGSETRAGLTKWIGYYNTNRPHSALAGATPDEACGQIRARRVYYQPRPVSAADLAVMRRTRRVAPGLPVRGQPDVA